MAASGPFMWIHMNVSSDGGSVSQISFALILFPLRWFDGYSFVVLSCRTCVHRFECNLDVPEMYRLKSPFNRFFGFENIFITDLYVYASFTIDEIRNARTNNNFVFNIYSINHCPLVPHSVFGYGMGRRAWAIWNPINDFPTTNLWQRMSLSLHVHTISTLCLCRFPPKCVFIVMR